MHMIHVHRYKHQAIYIIPHLVRNPLDTDPLNKVDYIQRLWKYSKGFVINPEDARTFMEIAESRRGDAVT